MEHIDWIDPDNIILANSSSEPVYKKITKDVRENGVDKIRLLKVVISKKISISYFRYSIGNEINWFYISNDETRNGTYYTFVYNIKDDEIIGLNNLYKEFDREDKLNQLFSFSK